MVTAIAGYLSAMRNKSIHISRFVHILEVKQYFQNGTTFALLRVRRVPVGG